MICAPSMLITSDHIHARSWNECLPWSWSFEHGYRCVASRQYLQDSW